MPSRSSASPSACARSTNSRVRRSRESVRRLPLTANWRLALSTRHAAGCCPEMTVPAEEKLYSVFEPHTDLIKRGKARKPVEFGHKVFLAESARGLITEYRVLDGNPCDTNHVKSSLENHQKTFGHVPELYATDRGFFSAENEAACRDGGVKNVCIPQAGGNKTSEREILERSREFKKGQGFRAGIEGRISVLFRGRGMKRCLAKGRQRFEILVGAAVLANNLMRIAELLKDKKTKPKRRAA